MQLEPTLCIGKYKGCTTIKDIDLTNHVMNKELAVNVIILYTFAAFYLAHAVVLWLYKLSQYTT